MERKPRIKRLVNSSIVKNFIAGLNPALRVSKEFIEELDALTKAKVEHAVRRQRSKKGVTLKKDPLYM